MRWCNATNIRYTHPIEFWPHHCWRRKMKKAMKKRMKFPFPKKASFQPRPLRASRSSMIAASISAISWTIAGESSGSHRRYAKFARASWFLPTDASHLGDSWPAKLVTSIDKNRTFTLIVKIPRAIIPAGTSWSPKGILQINTLSVIWMPMPSMKEFSWQKKVQHNRKRTHSWQNMKS